MTMCLVSAFVTSMAQAATVKVNVVTARTEPKAFGGLGVAKGTPVATYKYILNIDNTGSNAQRSPTPGTGCSPQDTGYPDSCKWTSIAGAKSNSPIYAQGDQTDFGAGLNLPDGRYLISVLADGYKLDGQHFSVSGASVIVDGVAVASGMVTVQLQPGPLPDAQIQAAVFEDIAPVNSAPDLPAEHGLAGFQGHILDYLGEVTTNVYGDPLCSKYDATGALITGSGGRCLSACYVVSNGVDLGTVAPVDAAGRCPVDSTGLLLTKPDGTTTTAPAGGVVEGKVKVPNLGPNRYTLSVTPPDGSGWVQTTTLEGNHDWDAWVMEGATGLDTEFVIAGEPFPGIIFGYVPVPGTPSGAGQLPGLTGSGTIKGVVDAVKIYVPTTGGVGGLPGAIWGGLQGAKIDKPIPYPWVTLTSLDNGDTVVWVGQGDANGQFSIPNVPAGAYTVTWWDEPQNTILDLVNVTVANGETIDMGILPLTGWWTFFDGYVFNDTNRNGVRDAGEPGIPGYTLTMRKRENSLMDRGTTVTTTDVNGYYKFEAGYPMTQWLVMEAYDDLHYTTGVTYQADNQPTPTTIIGAGVDVSIHPIIGLSGTMDWGKHTYDATGSGGIDPRNGGIVGTVSYDTTRNETDPRYAAVEDWQPSIPDLIVKLFAPVPCGTPGANCDSTGLFETATDGSLAKGKLLNTYLSETWQRPTGCIARGLDGTPMVHGLDEQVLPLDDALGCIEAPLMGIQFGTYATGQGTPSANFGAAVDGNYGFGAGCLDSNGTLDATDPSAPLCKDGTGTEIPFTTLPAGNYLVQVEIPNDALGRPMYKVTREEDINVANGDAFIPAVPPSACAGPMHTVDSSDNPTFVSIGGSPYEGQQKPLCDTKLVTLGNGKSIAPAFNLYTDVPIPGRHWFIVIDDLNFSSNPRSITFGEKAGMPFVPVGIYDWTDRLVTTVESDYNGLADVLLPSTNRISCPTPSGVCGNLYRYVGNDPGVPGRLNLNFNPQYRTIAAEFEVLPGLIVPADLAATQVGVSVQLPGVQTTSPVMCKLDDATPEIYRVDRPYGSQNQAFTITGKGFGASGTVKFDATALPAAWVAWSDTSITITPADYSIAAGPHQVSVTAGNGQSTVNGITYHYLRATGANGGRYNPTILEVGPGKTYAPAETLPAVADHAIQRALDAAPAGALVAVYPNDISANPRQNPRGAYYENLIISKSVKLQGVGPGSPNGSVRGSIIDGAAFAGDSPVATDWYTNITGKTWAGNQNIYDGAVISLYLPSSGGNAFPTAYNAKTAPSIDGFDLRGGDQQGFPGNINVIGGTPTGLPGGLVTQGGAIFANGYANNLQITNNVVQNNGGAYGTIRIGTPDLPAPNTNNHNDRVVIAYNRVIKNAGTNQAGGIGLFAGSTNYQVASNDICGNFSSEYGGGISAIGMNYNPGSAFNATTNFGGTINNNRIYFNQSFDEGGGIMIAGALPANTSSLSPGSGPVSIYNNLIQANLSNDDGGGVRFLMAGNFPMNVYNNFIVNNISTHEGGGIAINDTPNVRVYNNTIMKNQTTATAVTSSGAAAPAGLSTSMNSIMLQATLPSGSPLFSDPLLFNNIFWDNRAGTRALTSVLGLSDADANHWDMGLGDGDGQLSPTNSVLQSETLNHNGIVASPTNVVDQDPGVLSSYGVAVTFNSWRNNPAFLGAIMISVDLPPNLMGDYHITNASPAYNVGAASKVVPSYQGASTLAAPAFDIDGGVRPTFGSYDIGADEIPAPTANLGITKSDGLTSVTSGQALTYTITVTNAGPSAVSGATVTDTMPAALSGVTWTCAPEPNCGATSGSGNIATTVDLANGESAVFTVQATVATTASGSLANTATVATPGGTVDPTPADNSATDTDTIVIPADLSITTTDGLSIVNRGGALRYTTVVTNAGSNAVTGALVRDAFPSALSGTINWTCTTTGGATCGGGASTTGSGTINRTVNMPVGSTITFTTTSGSVSTSTLLTSISNTATVTVPGTYAEQTPADNTATDTTTIQGYHLAATSATSVNTSTTRWSASVTVTVHDASHNPASNVAVNGGWVSGGSGGTSCTTNGSGQCTLTRTGINRSQSGITLTVNGMSSAPNGYQAGLNEASAIVVVGRP